MAEIADKLPPTVQDLIYRTYANRADDWRRSHFGASVAGGSCWRALWYGFRWAKEPGFDGRMQRLFDTGQREELRVIEDLRNAGLQVWDLDRSGKQYTYSFGGHVQGSVDGVVRGVPGAEKTPHVLEVKTANARQFSQLAKKGVRLFKPVHWAQMQIGMRGMSLTRALYICVCKDTDDIYSERIKLDAAEAKALVQRAEMIAVTDTPPDRVSEKRSHWECKFCPYLEVCHGKGLADLEVQVPLQNCRTCISCHFDAKGKVECRHHKTELSPEQQRDGCGQHLFTPGMLTFWDLQDAGEGWTSYKDSKGRTWINKDLDLSLEGQPVRQPQGSHE